MNGMDLCSAGWRKRGVKEDAKEKHVGDVGRMAKPRYGKVEVNA